MEHPGLCRYLPLPAVGLAVLLSGCGRQPQSALHPAGTEAEQIATLFWWMAGGGLLIWLVVMAIAAHAMHLDRKRRSPRKARWLIVGGGAVFPSLLLMGLLIYGLLLIPSLRSAEEPDLRITVTGEQWWWRVVYDTAGGQRVELANEIRLPVDQRVAFTLKSHDVIHSFWIPSLGGKVDMIPGRVTHLNLKPERVGLYRGACAEYCGTSHALMNFKVKVQTQTKYREWLDGQARPAQAPASARAREGRQAFMRNGCGACHRIRGTSAQGRVGPDLTHVGSRLGLAADVLPNTQSALERWIAHPHSIKPDAKMPAFGMLAPEERVAIAVYLEGLK